MNIDDLLKDGMTEHAEDADFEQILEDPRFDRLVEGNLSAEEQADFSEEIRADPKRREMYEALSPLAAESRDRIVEMAKLGILVPDALPNPETSRREGRRRPRWWISLAATAATVAAAGILFVEVDPRLPRYTLAVEGGDKDFRTSGLPDTTPQFDPTSTIAIVLRPVHRVGDEVGLRAWQRSERGLERIDIRPTVSESGAVRVLGQAGHLFGTTPGTREVILAIGRPGQLPDAEEVITARSETTAWQAFDISFRIKPSP